MTTFETILSKPNYIQKLNKSHNCSRYIIFEANLHLSLYPIIHIMKNLYYCIFLLLFGFISMNAQTQLKDVSKSPLTIGEVIHFKSKILSESRTLNVYLPDGYSVKDTLKYPVIYVLDGGMEEDFIDVVRVVQFYNSQMGMPKSIVVGIANTDRKRDFTYPTTDRKLQKDYPTTGGSRKFIGFLESEVQPYISDNYATTKEKTLIGQSLGGLLATEILLKTPHLFDQYIIVSPSLWWDNETLLKEAKMMMDAQQKINANVYIAVGKEGDLLEGEAKRLAELLKNSGKANLNVEFLFLPNENPKTILHQGVMDSFKLMYKEDK